MNNINITYNNSIATTTYTNNTNNIANDTDITYKTVDTYNKSIFSILHIFWTLYFTLYVLLVFHAASKVKL